MFKFGEWPRCKVLPHWQLGGFLAFKFPSSLFKFRAIWLPPVIGSLLKPGRARASTVERARGCFLEAFSAGVRTRIWPHVAASVALQEVRKGRAGSRPEKFK